MGYAYTRIETEKAERLLLAIGSEDQIQIWLNGELIHLSLASRTLLPAQEIVVADFKKGANHLLVKVARRSGGWGFYLQQLASEGKLFINKTKLTGGSVHNEEQYLFIPDLCVGEKTDVSGYVPVTNTTTRPLTTVRISVSKSQVLDCTVSDVNSIMPGQTSLLPFRLHSQRPIQPPTAPSSNFPSK